MDVFIEKTSEKKDMGFSGTGKRLLDTLGINPETVILVREGRLLTLDTKLSDKDSIRILSVISGG